MLDLMDTLGAQIGDYVERRLAEEAVLESERARPRCSSRRSTAW
jgi:GAF domain-containing protein